jgi:hypothetical protein
MIGERSLWILSLLGAMGLAGLTIILFRAPSSEQKSGQLSKASVASGVALKRVVSEDAVLLDKTPLFLPTDLNTAEKDVSLPKTGGIFSDFPPIFAYSEFDVGFGGMRASENVVVNNALELASGAPLALGFGRLFDQATGINPQRFYLDILSAKDGAQISQEVLLSNPPRTDAIWRPIEFMALIGTVGLEAPLIQIARSGSDEIDAYFSDFLARKLKRGANLSPGTYRLIVGP